MTTEAYPPPRWEGVYTARYQDARQSQLVCVRTSLGYPRFMPAGLAAVMVLAPKGLFHIEDDAEFERLYREKLTAVGVDRIRRDVERIRDVVGRPGIALCCYEDVTKPGEVCHRSMFAAWWREQTGESIPELSRLSHDELLAVWPERAREVAQAAQVQGAMF